MQPAVRHTPSPTDKCQAAETAENSAAASIEDQLQWSSQLEGSLHFVQTPDAAEGLHALVQDPQKRISFLLQSLLNPFLGVVCSLKSTNLQN